MITDEKGLRSNVLAGLIDDHVRADEVLVEANRKVGDLLPKQAAIEYVAAHVGLGEIRLTNRDFSGFVVVAQNGVATGWTAEEVADRPQPVVREGRLRGAAEKEYLTW